MRWLGHKSSQRVLIILRECQRQCQATWVQEKVGEASSIRLQLCADKAGHWAEQEIQLGPGANHSDSEQGLVMG